MIRLAKVQAGDVAGEGPVTVAGPCAVLVVNATVGLIAVSQTTPYWVGLGTPRLTIVPLPMAVVWVIFVTAWVVTVGAIKEVKVTSLP